MTFFKEIQVGKFVLRFMPSDNGWMCGISKEMMEALETQQKLQEKEHEWVGLTKWELIQCGVLPFGKSYEICQAIEEKLKEKNT